MRIDGKRIQTAGVRPWKYGRASPPERAAPVKKGESQEKIQLCLACPKADCTGHCPLRKSKRKTAGG